MSRLWLLYMYLLAGGVASGQFSFDSLLNSRPELRRVAKQHGKYHLQIVYTQVNRTAGQTSFTTYSYQVSPQNYLYCASLIKLPTCILALQKLNNLHIDPGTTMYTDSSRACHTQVTKDSSALNGLPSVANYIKKMCLVSDNAAFSRVYEFLGVDYMHQEMTRMGFSEVRIVNRYDGNCTGKENLVTNRVRFVNDQGQEVYRQEETTATGSYPPLRSPIKVGRAYQIGKKLVRAPKDFSYSNYLSLADCHQILFELVFDQKHVFNINEGQRAWLLQQLSLYPRQSYSPRYDARIFPDAYKKYLYYGAAKEPISDSTLVITNIVGQSYGFMSDCAYFRDEQKGIEFILSAGLYANEDEVIDGKYDYKTVALPFLAALGKAICEFEIQRKIK